MLWLLLVINLSAAWQFHFSQCYQCISKDNLHHISQKEKVFQPAFLISGHHLKTCFSTKTHFINNSFKAFWGIFIPSWEIHVRKMTGMRVERYEECQTWTRDIVIHDSCLEYPGQLGALPISLLTGFGSYRGTDTQMFMICNSNRSSPNPIQKTHTCLYSYAQYHQLRKNRQHVVQFSCWCFLK